MFRDFRDLIQNITSFLSFNEGSTCSVEYTYTNETTFEIIVKINKHLGVFYSRLDEHSFCEHEIVLANEIIKATELFDLAETFNIIAYNVEQYLKSLYNEEQYLKSLEPHKEEDDIFINVDD